MTDAWVIGHRGSPTFEVENTIASFERAVDLDGAAGLEVDLCVTKDREIIVWHDWLPTGFESRCRQWGLEPDVAFRPRLPDRRDLRRPISELYSDDVRRHFGYARKNGPRDRISSAWIPTLDDFLKLVARKPDIGLVYFDVKIPSDELDLVEVFLARLHTLVQERAPSLSFVLETAEPAVLAVMKRLAPQHRYALDAGPLVGIVPSAHRHSAVRQAIFHGNTSATLRRPPYSCVRPFETYCRIARYDLELRARHNAECEPAKRVRDVVGFTINEPSEMACAIDLGIDGLQTDRPDRLRYLVDARKTMPPGATLASAPELLRALADAAA